jgi:hypothetical protein
MFVWESEGDDDFAEQLRSSSKAPVPRSKPEKRAGVSDEDAASMNSIFSKANANPAIREFLLRKTRVLEKGKTCRCCDKYSCHFSCCVRCISYLTEDKKAAQEK